jgi:hypothetical protein
MVALTPQEVQGNVAEPRNGLGSRVFANPAGILIKGHIEAPMARVLKAPVLPHGLGEPNALRRPSGQALARVDLHRLAHLPTRLHPPHPLHLGPGGRLPSPLDSRGEPLPTGFKATMSTLHRCLRRGCKVSDRGAPGRVDTQRHIRLEGLVLVRQRPDIIGLLLRHDLRHLLLTPHGLNRDAGIFDVPQA